LVDESGVEPAIRQLAHHGGAGDEIQRRGEVEVVGKSPRPLASSKRAAFAA
jgi:hypothetical protein